MKKNGLSSKIFLIDRLISLKKIFDVDAIGEVNGDRVAIYCLWFDKNLFIKQIEITAMAAAGGPQNGFFSEGDFSASRIELSFGGPVKMTNISLPEYAEYVGSLEKTLYYVCFWDLGKTAVKPLKVDINGQRLQIFDFLINPENWKIEKIIYGNPILQKTVAISGVISKSRENQCFTFSR